MTSSEDSPWISHSDAKGGLNKDKSIRWRSHLKWWLLTRNMCHLFDLQKDTNLAQWDSYTWSDEARRYLDIMWAASLEWPMALRMAHRVSTRVDLTAGSDESLSHRRPSWHLESAEFNPQRTAGLDPLGTGPSTPETMKLHVAVERSESPWLLVTERSSGALEGPSWMAGGKAYRRPLPLSQGTDMASVHSALGSGYGDTNLMSHLLANVANKSTCCSPHWANTGRRCSMAIVHSVFSVWPTLDRESAWMLWTPGRWSPCDRTTWADVSSTALVCMIVCLPRSWCKPQSLRCRTWSVPPGTSDEAGSLSQRWWRPASPERWCATIFEMLTTVPVSSVSLTGLPSLNWTHSWRESLPSPWWRGEVLVGLLEMLTRPPLTAPTEELWSGRSSSRSSGTKLWQPTTGPDEDNVFPMVPVKP